MYLIGFIIVYMREGYEHDLFEIFKIFALVALPLFMNFDDDVCRVKTALTILARCIMT